MTSTLRYKLSWKQAQTTSNKLALMSTKPWSSMNSCSCTMGDGQEVWRNVGCIAGAVPHCRCRLHSNPPTFSHELWVATERTRSRVQAAEMRVAGLGRRDRVRSSNTCGELGAKRGQLRWMRPEFLWDGACPTGEGVDSGLSGGIAHPIWPGNTLEPLGEKAGTPPFLRHKNQVWKTLLFPLPRKLRVE